MGKLSLINDNFINIDTFWPILLKTLALSFFAIKLEAMMDNIIAQ